MHPVQVDVLEQKQTHENSQLVLFKRTGSKKNIGQILHKMYRNENTTIRSRKNFESWIGSYDHRRNENSKISPIFNVDGAWLKYESHNKQDQPKNIHHKSSVMDKVRTHLDTYFERCTLHGLRYVGDNNISIGERVFWFLSFLSAVAFAAYFICNLYSKWYTSPVITSFSPEDASIDSIPFPSITICNMNQAKKKEAEDIVRNGPEVERRLLDDYCNLNNSFSDLTDEMDSKWDTVLKFLLRVGQPCSEMLKTCFWRQEKQDCNYLFNSELTDEGLCCSFNMLPKEHIFKNPKELAILNSTYPSVVYDWNPEKGFTNNVPIDALPIRPIGGGAHLGLTLLLDVQMENYYCSSTNSYGFKVLLSNPIETPKMADFSFFLTPGVETRIVINPTIQEATRSLRSIDVQKRRCYFADERPLQFYRTYTIRNCKLECQANYTLSICKCVPYFLPKNYTTKICGKRQELCSNRAKADMEIISKNGSQCSCLPGCFELDFEENTSYGHIIQDNVENGIFENLQGVGNISIAHFYFKGVQFKKVLRSELYGFSEFLSNTGGLLGLFLGFSFLSAVEIIYYVSLKLICDKARSFRKKQPKNIIRLEDSNTLSTGTYPFIK